MFVLGFFLGVLVMAVLAGLAYWWWLAPLPSATALAARQAIHDIERRTVQALLREEWVGRQTADAEGTASEVERS